MTLPGFRRTGAVALFYAAVLVLAFLPVSLNGRTLNAALYFADSISQSDLAEAGAGNRVSHFHIDLGTPAFYEAPIDRLVGSLYKEGVLPLWNPYQGAGMPLAAQYSSRVFFPYQILQNLAPERFTDLFSLAGPGWPAC